MTRSSGAVRPRWRDMAGEAWRDLTSGSTHAVVWMVLWVALAGGLGWLDTSYVGGLVDRAVTHVAAGGATWILEAPGRISGPACDALAEATGVHAAGALRPAGKIATAALPGAPLARYDVSPGFGAVVGTGSRQGVLVSDQAAEQLDLGPAQTVSTAVGPIIVGGVYAYPDDGRRPGLGYALLSPTVAPTPFDECWLTVWPADAATTALVHTSVLPASDPNAAPPRLSQLNSTLAADFDATAQYTGRPTGQAPAAGLICGLAIGFASVWLRRLHLASELHCGVTRPALTWQILLETLAWCAAAFVVAVVVVMLTALRAAQDRTMIAALGLRPPVAGFAGALTGAIVASLGVREKHLFRLFKNR